MTDRWTELRHIVEGMLPQYPYTGAEVRQRVLRDVLDAMDRPASPSPAAGGLRDIDR